MLSEETCKKTTKLELTKILWEESTEEKAEYRSKSIKGLIQEKAKTMLQSLTQTLKETKEFLTIWTNAAWNGFFENIWKKCCEVVTNWEKANGISPTDKKQSRSRLNSKASDRTLHERKKGEVADNQNQIMKEKKEKDRRKIQSSCFLSVIFA